VPTVLPSNYRLIQLNSCASMNFDPAKVVTRLAFRVIGLPLRFGGRFSFSARDDTAAIRMKGATKSTDLFRSCFELKLPLD
jgi:hypothetical protein